MARPTGIRSRARRVPVDIDETIEREAQRRGTTWVVELRRLVAVPDDIARWTRLEGRTH